MKKDNEARKARAHKTRMRRRRKQNRSAVLCISLIAMMLLGVMTVQNISLYNKRQSYQAREEDLQTQLESEEQRQIEMEQYKKYVDTEEYIEQAAKSRLGLVYPNEIIFKEKDKED